MKKKTPKKRPSVPSPGQRETGQQGPPDDELLPEYNPALIRNGVRGKHASRYAEGTNVVVLDPDVAAAFPNTSAVNGALRKLVKMMRERSRPGS